MSLGLGSCVNLNKSYCPLSCRSCLLRLAWDPAVCPLALWCSFLVSAACFGVFPMVVPVPLPLHVRARTAWLKSKVGGLLAVGFRWQAVCFYLCTSCSCQCPHTTMCHYPNVCVCVCASPSLAFFRNPAPRRFHCGHPSCKPADIRNTYLRRSPFIGCPSNHHSQVVKFRHRHCGFSKNSDSCDLSFWSLSDIWLCCGLLGWYVELLHSTSRLGSLKCFQSCLWANYWWKIHTVLHGDIYDDIYIYI